MSEVIGSRLIDTDIGIPPFNVAFVFNRGDDATGTVQRDIRTQTIFATVDPLPPNFYFRTVNGAYDALQRLDLPLDKRIICLVQIGGDAFPAGRDLTNDREYSNIIFTSIIIEVAAPSGVNGKLGIATQFNETVTIILRNCSIQNLDVSADDPPRGNGVIRFSNMNVIRSKIIVTLIPSSGTESQETNVSQLNIISEEYLLFDDVTFVLEANPETDDFICLQSSGIVEGAFPNLDSEADKDIIIIQGSTNSDMNFDGNSFDNDIDIESNGGVTLIKLVDPNSDTKVFIEDFNFTIDTKDTKSAALFMTEGNNQQLDGLFTIEENNFTSEEFVNFNNTSSLTSLFNSFNNVDFIYTLAEAQEDLDSDIIEIPEGESPINNSMTDLSFHSTVSQFYIPGTIDKSVELEVNDRFIYYVNAENNNIVITLPSGGSEVEGKMLIFKRIDNSNKRVTIIPKEGLIENKKRLRFSENVTKCKEEDNKYPAVTLHFHERNWWIISAYNL